MAEPYQQSVEQTLKQQQSATETGLSRSEVRHRRHRYGANCLRQAASRPAWRILIDQLESVVVILLLSAAAAVFGRTIEVLAISAAILINTLIGFGMEWRATRAMEVLRRMGKAMVRVRRDDSMHEIAADALVPDDIVLLEAGDMIAADLRLIEAKRLQCDESALTGESLAVDKTTEPLPEPDIPLAERTNMAYKGTAVTQGSGAGVVVSTGQAIDRRTLQHVLQLAALD